MDKANKQSNKGLLYFGLPAVNCQGGYLVYSPYKKQIVFLNQDEWSDIGLVNDFVKDNFIVAPGRVESDYDLELLLFITQKCNLKCKYCFGNYGENKDEMSKELAINILRNQLKKLDKKDSKVKVWFSGGEPTLNFRVIGEIVKYLRRRRIWVDYIISTNGVMSEDRLDFLIDNNFSFKISCDGLPVIQDRQRPFKNNSGPSLVVEKTVKLLVKNKKDFLIKMVVTNESLGEMLASVKYLVGLGVRYIRIDHVRLHGRADKNFKPVDQDIFITNFLQILDWINKNHKKVVISNISIGRFWNPRLAFCRMVANPKALAINWDGNISKCIESVEDGNSCFAIGRFKDKQLVLDTNQKHQLENLSVDMMDGCNDCFIKYICGGGCFYRNNLMSGSVLIPDKYDCEFKKKMIRRLIIYFYESSG